MGNTVLVVEHDAETIERADYVIDLGPGAGRLGGDLVASGTPAEIDADSASLTGRTFQAVRRSRCSTERRQPNGKAISDSGRARKQSEESRCRVSAGNDDGGDGRVGQREIDAG